MRKTVLAFMLILFGVIAASRRWTRSRSQLVRPPEFLVVDTQVLRTQAGGAAEVVRDVGETPDRKAAEGRAVSARVPKDESSFVYPSGFVERDEEAPTVAEFLNSKPADLRELWAKAPPFKGFRVAYVGVLGGAQSGCIDVNGVHLDYRFSVGAKPESNSRRMEPASCFSLRAPSLPEVYGTIADGNLSVRDGPYRTSYIFELAQRHYFLTFNCIGTGGNCREAPERFAMLYYLKQPDGSIVYQGRAHRDAMLSARPDLICK